MRHEEKEMEENFNECGSDGSKYDVSEDVLKLECVICADEEDTFEYVPTENETELIKAMLEEKIREYYDCTPQEFCESERGMRMSQ